MTEEKSLNSRTNKKRWGSRFSSHSGTLVLSGLILIGFIIAWLFGGFPSILLPSFIILAIGLLIDIFSTISKSAPKKDSEPIKPLRGILLLVVFYLIFGWMTEALLPLLGGPTSNKIFYKVEFPFSEASHVVVDSEGSVYVFSQFNKRVQKYNKDGRFQYGWFASKWKGAEVAIDDNDFIYVYVYYGVRKYNSDGKLIDEIDEDSEGNGWWRFNEKSITWDKDSEEPRRYDLYDKEPIQYGDVYNTAVKENDLMPAFESRKSGFKTADAKYYKLTRLWHLFPVVSVNRYLSEFEGYIMPNPLSLLFTFVFPGFLFYVFALFLAWALEKPAERLTKRFLASAAVTAVVFIIAAAAIVMGGSVVMFVANALPKSNPMHFWLVPIVVIPYWIIVIIAALWTWRSLLRRLDKTRLANDSGERQDNTPTIAI